MMLRISAFLRKVFFFRKNEWLAQEGWREMKVAKARYSKRCMSSTVNLTEFDVDSRGRENVFSSQRK